MTNEESNQKGPKQKTDEAIDRETKEIWTSLDKLNPNDPANQNINFLGPGLKRIKEEEQQRQAKQKNEAWRKKHPRLERFNAFLKNLFIVSKKINSEKENAEEKEEPEKQQQKIGRFKQHILDRQLLEAAKMGNVAGVEKALNRGAYVNTTGSQLLREKTPLHFAVEKGHQDVVKLLVEKGADVNAEYMHFPFKWIRTPLDLAENTEIADFLKAHGAKTYEGVGYQELVDRRKILSDEEKNELNRKLILAARLGHKENVRKAIDNGADIHAKDAMYRTALEWAIFNEYEDIIKLLLDEESKEIHLPMTMNLKEINEKLIETIKREDWQISNYPHRIALIKYLLEKGNPNYQEPSKGRCTPLFNAISKEDKIIIRILLMYGADPTIKNAGGINAIEYAAARNVGKEIIELLENAAKKLRK